VRVYVLWFCVLCCCVVWGVGVGVEWEEQVRRVGWEVGCGVCARVSLNELCVLSQRQMANFENSLYNLRGVLSINHQSVSLFDHVSPTPAA
jgi:hypothetical protein